jgi:hypothetical protein
MVEQGQQPHRRGAFGPGLRQLQQQAPGHGLRQGRPAVSSAAMFQRPRCAITRCASPRSGVTTATRRSGTASAWRTRMAMACASSSGWALCIRRTPASRRSAAGRCTQAALASGGRNRLEMARLRAGGAAAIPARCQLRTSSRARPMRCSSSFR